MPNYLYHALNAEQQPVTGEVTADTLSQALAQLDSLGLRVQSIADRSLPLPASEPVHSAAETGRTPFADAQAATALQQQMARVLQRGKDLLPPLRAFAEELPAGRRRRQLELLINTLARGDEPEALATLRSLPGYWIPLLGAATASRNPERILREFLRESQRAEELRRQWWLTLAYPLLVLGLASAVLVAFSFLVIPIFRNIFLGFGIQVPLLTRIVLALADWVTSGKLVLAGLISLLTGFCIYRSYAFLPAGFRHGVGDCFATLPGHSTVVARFTQFTADLLESELETSQALRLAGLTIGSGAVHRAALRVASQLEGSPPLAPNKNRRLLTRTVMFAISFPEGRSAQIRLLREISTNHAERMRLRLSWTRGMIEPLAICVIGLLVGGTALALFLPLIQLLQGLA